MCLEENILGQKWVEFGLQFQKGEKLGLRVSCQVQRVRVRLKLGPSSRRGGCVLTSGIG